MSGATEDETSSGLELDKHCHSCGRELSPDRKVYCCLGCIVTIYCSEACRESDQSKHEPNCPTVAQSELAQTLRRRLGRDADQLKQVAQLRSFVQAQGQLPGGVAKVDELIESLREDFPHTTSTRQACYFALLALRVDCAQMGLGKLSLEGFVTVAKEMIFSLPPDSRTWMHQEVAFVCQACGEMLCELGRVHEAVELGRRVKAPLEASLQTDFWGDPEELKTRTAGVCKFLKDLAIWLANSVNYVTEDGDECMDTEEAEAVMQQAIDLATTASVDPESVGYMYLQLVVLMSRRRVYDETLKVARRGSQYAGKFQQELVAQTAVCLVELGRDAQAEPILRELMLKIRRTPRLLSENGRALCRRGEYNRAYTTLMKSAELLRALKGPQVGVMEAVYVEMAMQAMDAFEQMGGVKHVEAMEASAKREHATVEFERPVRPRQVLREANRLLTAGQREGAMGVLRVYASNFGGKKRLEWRLRGRWREGDAFKPLEMLRDLLEEGNDERARVEALIARTAIEDEALRQQALEEVQKEMREEGARRKQAEPAGQRPAKASKASRKKRKKRERKRQQGRAEHGGAEEAEAADVDLAGLSLKDEEEAAGGAAEAQAEEQDEEEECPMCLLPFGEDKDDEEQDDEEGGEDVLGCGHRFHGGCIDRWLCKCREKGLLPTCPMCRRELARGAGGGKEPN